MSSSGEKAIERPLIPKFFENLLTVMGKTSGRDKAFKLIQYTIRFHKVVLFKNKKFAKHPLAREIFGRLMALASAFSLARNAMRLGRPFTSYSNVIRNIIKYRQNRNDKNPFNKWRSLSYTITKSISDFGLMVNFLFDHILFLCKIDILKSRKLRDDADLISNYFWLIDCLASFYADGYDIFLLRKEVAALKEENEDEALSLKIKDKEEQIMDKSLTYIKNLVELPTIFFYIDESKYISHAKAYFLISFSSIISLYSLWPSH